MLEQITTLLSDGGLFTTQDAGQAGVPRHQLAQMVKTGELERVSHGLYTLPGSIYDRYEALQKKASHAIFSHETALYFHKLSDRTPHVLHITVPQGFNASRLKGREKQLKVHYVQKDVFELGLMKMKSPFGGSIHLYDSERTICDIIQGRQEMDTALFSEALKLYFSSGTKQLRKLIRYSRALGVESELRMYMEVL